MKTNNLPRIAGIMVICDDEVLLCRRSENESYPGYWGIPSGHINKGENVRDAAKREYKEETNLTPSNNLKLIGFIPMGKTLLYVYQMKVKEKIYPDLENAKDGYEHDQCGWFKFDDIPSKIDENLKKVIELTLNK